VVSKHASPELAGEEIVDHEQIDRAVPHVLPVAPQRVARHRRQIGHGASQRLDVHPGPVTRDIEDPLGSWRARTRPFDVVAEIGAGLNGKRKELLCVLRDPKVSRIVVEHRDRLAQFGYEMPEAALSAAGKRVVVVEEGGVTDDLVRDLLEILTAACGRLYGSRSARNRARRALEAAVLRLLDVLLEELQDERLTQRRYPSQTSTAKLYSICGVYTTSRDTARSAMFWFVKGSCATAR
jgi:hypothetical protein